MIMIVEKNTKAIFNNLSAIICDIFCAESPGIINMPNNTIGEKIKACGFNRHAIANRNPANSHFRLIMAQTAQHKAERRSISTWPHKVVFITIGGISHAMLATIMPCLRVAKLIVMKKRPIAKRIEASIGIEPIMNLDENVLAKIGFSKNCD